MRSTFVPISLLLALSVLVAACGRPSPTKSTETPASPTAAALRQFDNGKFGMFIHWGLYALPAGEWKGQYVRGIGEWIMNRAQIPVKEYEQLARRFNPVRFDADAWAQLARDAGMRYMVITAKHHDGFSMFDSAVTKYDIVDATPYKKDPLKPLSQSCSQRGIQFGFYYSQDQDWHEPNGRGNTWDFPADRKPEEYLRAKVMPQVRELLTNYGQLGLIWFDTPGMLSEQQVKELRKLVKDLQPSCLLNSRIGHNQGDYLQTGDNAIPIQVYTKQKWEVPATLNDTWGYKKNDTHWKEPADLVAKLADIASKGGNYLLNVGPTAEGEIPPAAQQILRTIGQWVNANGESIYGTQPSPFYLPGIDWRCTVKPGRVYLHLLNWPGKSFRFAPLENRVRRAYLLKTNQEVAVRQDGGELVFDLPATAPDPYDSVLVLDIGNENARARSGFGSQSLPERLDLYAWVARLRGEEIRYDRASASATHFEPVETEKNELWWYPYEALSGNYGVEVTYSADQKTAGGQLHIGVHRGNQAPADKELTIEIDNTKAAFVTRPLEGLLSVSPSDQHISLSVTGPQSAGVRIQKITLIRK